MLGIQPSPVHDDSLLGKRGVRGEAHRGPRRDRRFWGAQVNCGFNDRDLREGLHNAKGLACRGLPASRPKGEQRCFGWFLGTPPASLAETTFPLASTDVSRGLAGMHRHGFVCRPPFMFLSTQARSHICKHT